MMNNSIFGVGAQSSKLKVQSVKIKAYILSPGVASGYPKLKS